MHFLLQKNNNFNFNQNYISIPAYNSRTTDIKNDDKIKTIRTNLNRIYY